ncbi:histidine--tRNA ligase [Acidianus brierleyi]|uniref:Histidine--tRNA ligase n=1 Tax=Acidianus brierleyi TaxID=41673 RepID=A0A2U9IEI0_9CREN|nr:histidine--tRNA ligase [Acidianus brierleyi]AWR94448.1 histidine--tRNA ligase [Acidianus brierleyi]
MVSFEPVRGMKDYYGIEAKKLRYLEELFRKHVEIAGYQETITPIVEDFALFAIKSGEEIRNTMYVFKDKAEREVALRPEITPSIVRLYLNSMQHLPKPIRLYYIGRVYRYDEPQLGRYREFRQAGVEMLGSNSILSDIEIIKLLYDFYNELGLSKSILLKINNIGLYRSIFRKFNIEENVQEHLLHLIDKGKKDESMQILNKYISQNNVLNLINTLLYSNLKMDEVESEIQKIGIKCLDEEFNRFKKTITILNNLNIRSVVDLSFVRGLAYYTGIIFEITHPKVTFSVAGGGRYDNLVEIYGGTYTPAIGFAIGIERTSVLINYETYRSPQVVVIVLDDSVIDYALSILDILRSSDIIAILNVKEQSLGKLLSSYFEQNVRYAVIVGNNEKISRKVVLKDLASRSQEIVSSDELITHLRQIL